MISWYTRTYNLMRSRQCRQQQRLNRSLALTQVYCQQSIELNNNYNNIITILAEYIVLNVFYRLFVFRLQRLLNHSLLEGLEKSHSYLLDSLFRCYFPKHNTIFHERAREWSWLELSLQTCVVLWVESRYDHHLFIRYIFQLYSISSLPLFFLLAPPIMQRYMETGKIRAKGLAHFI